MNRLISIGGIFFIIIVVLIVLVLISCVKIVHQAQAVVVERLGAYLTTWNTGLHFKLPIIDRVAKRIDGAGSALPADTQTAINGICAGICRT